MRVRISTRGSGKIPMRIFSVIVMLFATVFGWLVVNSLQTSRTVANWDAVECVILKSGVERRAIDSFLFTAIFEYEVSGRKLRSSDIGRPSEGFYYFRSISERLPLLERFAVGSRHVCKVDPANPSCAVLVVDETSKTLGGVLALAFVCVFATLGVCIFWSSLGGQKSRLKRSSRPFAVFFIVFGLVFLCAGSGALIAYNHTRLEYSGFDSVEGYVLYAGLKSHSGDRGSTVYAPCIAYVYEVGGRKYENDRYSAIESSSSNRQRKQDIVNGYTPGASVTVYYSPDNPAKSCLLEPNGGNQSATIAALLGVFVVVGLFLIGVGVHALLPRRNKISKENACAYGLALRRRLGTEVVGILVFACFWNMISWTLAMVFLSDFTWSTAELPELFVVLFPAIGIVFAVKAVRSLLKALRGVHYKVSLSSDRLVPGGRVQVNCEQTGGGEVMSVRLVIVQWNVEFRVLRAGDPDPRTPARQTEVYVGTSSPMPRSWSASFEIPEAIDSSNIRWELHIVSVSHGRTKTEVFSLPVKE